ncbi:protein NRT1/ PTR FAMILY 2.4-like isoform X2 [Mercurialis annua]|uniref:protein NRT1/ PTR FAMILY 2.4-like isoform X2 n=1 Tax=Mercurialis annua TaxID=3986 RepID=UPI002160277D|nr:protein NRT1/ PTR FAMILY 2.4-like isoform X2 [Mercurialis annua]
MEAAPLLLSSLERKEEVTAEVKRIILAWFLITVTMVANSIADFGWSSNLIAFFINELNAGTIFATQINYVILGLDNFFVILGYIAADSFPSLVSVVTVSAFISFLGTIMLTITSSIKLSSNLYSWGAVFISMTLASLGGGCTRFTIESLGVGQFDREHNHLASTMIVLNRYTSFLIAAALSFLDGGPITSIPRVLRRILLWSEHFLEENCYLGDNTTKVQKFRFMVTKWRQLFTVEEAEDLKTLIKTMPLWPSDMVLLACISMLKGLSVLQARAIGNWNSNSSGNTNLTLSPGSYAYISQEAIVWTLMIAVWPCLSYAPKATWRHPLRLIATSHVCVIIAIVFSALIEPGIRDFVGSSAETASAWLIIQLAISGSGLCFYMVGQSILYTVEFPSSALTVSTSMYALFSGFGYLLSAVITGLLPAFTGWLPDDINHGRLDYVFWMLAVLAVLNFAYFQFCTANYKHPLADLDEEYHDAFVNKFILSRVLS